MCYGYQEDDILTLIISIQLGCVATGRAAVLLEVFAAEDDFLVDILKYMRRD